MQNFVISESVGGVHKNSQDAFYPIICFQFGICGRHDAYLLGSYFVTADYLSNPKLLAEQFRKANIREKNNIYQRFKENGYPYNREGIRAAREYYEAR